MVNIVCFLSLKFINVDLRFRLKVYNIYITLYNIKKTLFRLLKACNFQTCRFKKNTFPFSLKNYKL